MSDDRMWPAVPAELRYVDLRLPGTFRELVANRSFTNEEIGKIVRCIALDTDFFITQKIEADVLFYRDRLRKNNMSRLRMEALRKRRRMSAHAVPVQESAGAANPQERVTVTQVEGTAGNDGSDSLFSHEKSPPIIVEKTPPIVPLEKKSSSPLEKRRVKARGRTRRDVVADGIQSDLFALATGTAVGGAEKESSGRGQGGPVARPLASGDGITGQDIGSVSGAIPASIDTRDDAAWIPERFAAFWKQYPKKLAKADAIKAFTKLIKVQPDVDKFMSKVLSSIEWWKNQESWKKDGGKFVPYPATWLNRGHWGDCSENSETTGSAEFLRTDVESDEELIKRMQGG